MKGWQCRCGRLKGFGSDGPAACAFCEVCGTTVETSPELHKTERRPHEYYVETVETDEGPKPLSRCKFCYRTKAEIEATNAETQRPMNPQEGKTT